MNRYLQSSPGASECRAGKAETPTWLLPLEASPTIELFLSDAQIKRFAGLIALQRLQPGSQTFMVLASSYIPSEKRGILRLQAKLVGKKAAAKALKILRESELE